MFPAFCKGRLERLRLCPLEILYILNRPYDDGIAIGRAGALHSDTAPTPLPLCPAQAQCQRRWIFLLRGVQQLTPVAAI